MLHRKTKKGLPPGTLVYSGSTSSCVEPTLNLIIYDNQGHYEIHEHCKTHEDFRNKASKTKRYWYDFVGVHDVQQVREICETFNIHPLLQEDIVNCHQRPRMDEYPDYIFVVLRDIFMPEGEFIPRFEQISFVLGDGWLISFRESNSNISFDGVKKRMGNGRLVRYSTDYLCYALIDTIVDSYIEVGNRFEDEITAINLQISNYFLRMTEVEPPKETKPTEINEILRLHHLFKLKTSIQSIRKWTIPMRETLRRLTTYTDSDLMDEQISPYMSDVNGHLDYVVEGLSTLSELLTSMSDMLLGLSSFRMNMIMKLLAVISTIFIPLTFIAGIYGMNFEFMPELKFDYGYFVVIAIMVIIVLGTLLFFRKRSWM